MYKVCHKNLVVSEIKNIAATLTRPFICITVFKVKDLVLSVPNSAFQLADLVMLTIISLVFLHF